MVQLFSVAKLAAGSFFSEDRLYIYSISSVTVRNLVEIPGQRAVWRTWIRRRNVWGLTCSNAAELFTCVQRDC